MWYAKNVPAAERVIRILVGIAMTIAGYMLFGKPGALLLGLGGIGTVLTGFFGYCPACAMAGRRLRP